MLTRAPQGQAYEPSTNVRAQCNRGGGQCARLAGPQGFTPAHTPWSIRFRSGVGRMVARYSSVALREPWK